MICQRCHKREATVHITRIINGKKTELHLCDVCAKELTQKGELFYIDIQPTFASVVSTILSSSKNTVPSMDMLMSEVEKCPNCGMSYDEFQKTGRFGCSECYRAFKPYLLPVLRKIQGNVQHSGKRPMISISKSGTKEEELALLRKELEEAVRREDYERAAVLRDKIREISKDE